jgi:hypothetical protein
VTNLPAVQADPLNRRIPPWLCHLKMTCEFETEPRAFAEQLDQLYTLCHFPRPAITPGTPDLATGTAFATKTEQIQTGLADEHRIEPDKSDLIVNWKPGRESGVIEIAWICIESRAQYLSEAGIQRYTTKYELDYATYLKGQLRLPEMYRFAGMLRHEQLYVAKRSLPIGGGYVLAPGEQPDIEAIAAAGFVASDYSGCARADELSDLYDGVLPLGQYVFGKSDDALVYGPRLYLAPHENGALREYDGALVVAPINRGKTQLLKRWAVAANRAGYSILLVDVKGNLFGQVRGKLKGRVFHFSTDPDVPCGDTSISANASDRMNLLDGLEWRTERGRKRIDAIVEILLPAAGWRGEGGDADLRYGYRVKFLRAFVNILLIAHHYARAARAPDLGDLYDLVNSEARLIRCLQLIAKGEAAAEKNGPVPGLGFAWWAEEVAPLISSKLLPQLGKRDPTKPYTDYTLGILIALRPFARDGIFYRKIAAQGAGANISLDILGEPEQATFILALRSQDGLESDTLFSIAAKRLEQVLFERFKQDNPRPVLLLMDEAIRLREFDPPGFIAIAREAKAACVAVYQSLDPIEDDKRNLLLATVGTQIYLGSLPAGTAKLATEHLPKRTSNLPVVSFNEGPQGRTRSIAYPRETVPWVGMAELTQLPAWPYSAFVYIRDHRSRKPFIVDLDERPTRVIRVGNSAAAEFPSVREAMSNLLSAAFERLRSRPAEEPTSRAFWHLVMPAMPPRVQIRVESGDYRGGELKIGELLDVMHGRASQELLRRKHLPVFGNLEIVADDATGPKPCLPDIECMAGAISLRGLDLWNVNSETGQRVELEDCKFKSVSLTERTNILCRDCSFSSAGGKGGRLRIEGGGMDSAELDGVRGWFAGAQIGRCQLHHDASAELLDSGGSFWVGSERDESSSLRPSLALRCCRPSRIKAWGANVTIDHCDLGHLLDDSWSEGVLDVNWSDDAQKSDAAPPSVLSILNSEISAGYSPVRARGNVAITARGSSFLSNNVHSLALYVANTSFADCEFLGGVTYFSASGGWTFDGGYMNPDSVYDAGLYFDVVAEGRIKSRNMAVELPSARDDPLPGPVEELYADTAHTGYFVVFRHNSVRWLATRGGYYRHPNKLGEFDAYRTRFDALRNDSVVAIAADGGSAIEVSARLIRRWRVDVSSSFQIIAAPFTCEKATPAALSKTGAVIALGAEDHVYLHIANRWQRLETFHVPGLRLLKFAADGRSLIAGGRDRVCLYDLEFKKVVRQIRTPSAVRAADLRSSGSLAILTDDTLFLAGPGAPIKLDMKRLSRARRVGIRGAPASSGAQTQQKPAVTFVENLKEEDPETASLVVAAPGAMHVFDAQSLKHRVSIEVGHAAARRDASLLVTRAERVFELCLEDNGALRDYGYYRLWGMGS